MKKVSALAVSLFLFMASIGCGKVADEISAFIPLLAPAAVETYSLGAVASGKAVDPATVDKINAKAQNLANLYNGFKTASQSAQPGIMSEISVNASEFGSMLTEIFSTFQISDPNSQAKFTTETGLVLGLIASVQAGISVWEAQNGSAVSAPAHVMAHASVKVATVGHKPVSPFPMSAKAFKKAYNSAAGKTVLR